VTATLVPVSFPALGTTATVVVAGDDRAAAAALAAVRDELAAVDRACSRFRPDSELSQLNGARGQARSASPLFLEAVTIAIRAAQVTDGLVDPTIGRALRELGYDRDFAALVALAPRGPARVTLIADPAPGWRVVAVDRSRATVTVPEGVELDLGATAKAMAADRAARAAHQATEHAVLVSLGGDVSVAGPAPAGGWSIRVTDDHAQPVDGPGQTVTISTGGLATSGTTVRRWQQAGTEFHHLVDPATGRPAPVIWRTVSVAAASCVDANTASTAAVVLGRGAADWLIAHRLPARLVAPDGSVTTVSGWPQP
jgi:thiamine biosynthesis lipoprotein